MSNLQWRPLLPQTGDPTSKEFTFGKYFFQIKYAQHPKPPTPVDTPQAKAFDEWLKKSEIECDSCEYCYFYTKDGFKYPGLIATKDIPKYTAFIKIKSDLLLINHNVYFGELKDLFIKYQIKCDHRKNRCLEEITKELHTKGLEDKELLEIISNYKWKAGKGSNISLTLPAKNSSSLEVIAKFARIQNGGIKLSKKHISAFNENPSEILQKCEALFGIKPKKTGKNELIFCSNVLKLLFSKIIISTFYINFHTIFILN